MENLPDPRVFIIRDLQTLQIISDPLRSQIYEVIIDAPLTTRQIAGRLGLAPSKLYYHINLMEKVSLIRVVETRMVSNMVEKLYQAAAPELDIDPALLNFKEVEGRSNVRTVLATSIDATREDLIRSLEARQVALDLGAPPRPREVLVNRTLGTIPEARADEFRARLKALVDEFACSVSGQEPGQGESDQQTYGLLVAFYPVYYYANESAGAEQGQDANGTE